MKDLLENIYLQLFLIVVSFTSAVTLICKYCIKRYKTFKEKQIEKSRKKYYRELDSDEFISWRDCQLKKIYGNSYFTDVLGKTYPTFVVPFSEYFKYSDFKKKNVYSKEDICREDYKIENGEVVFPPFEETSIMTIGTSKEINEKRCLLKQYRKIIGDAVQNPKLIGFSLDHYDLNGKGEITHIYPKLGTYEYNVFSSHILEFELFKAYKKLSGEKDIPIETLWKYLPFRRYIHFGTGEKSEISEILFSGVRRFSLLSVQCIVVFKDYNHKDYRTLLMKRSTNPKKVSAKLGYYQFLPAGGFELYEKELIHSFEIVLENYSLRKAIFREYLEEVFDEKEFKAVDAVDNAETTDRILNHPQVLDVLDMIENGKASLNLLGVTVDLVALRHEISFVLLIDDENYSRKSFCPNDEFTRENSRASKIRIPIQEVEKLLSNKDNHIDPSPKFNQGSALLYKMFKDSPFFPY